ncbi:MAG TPA: hypothetical protein PKC54_12855, partial [Ferruginibacter sp.]|nr:hypothetical protein [Ferruginibacter sp.]
KKMAASRNMRLATEDEVIQAMFYLELTGPRAVINTGEFVYPVGGNFFVDQGEMIEPGLNRGISGDNDGFYYIDVKPEPGVIIDPIPALPNNRKPDFEIVIINNAWLKKALQKSNTTDVIIGDGDHWKIIYKDSFVKKGMVRIQHVKTGLYLMSIYSYNNPIPRIELGRPVNDYTFMLLGNYGLWTIEEMVTYPGYLAIKNEEGLFLNPEGGILQVTNIQSNWFSPAWQLIN